MKRIVDGTQLCGAGKRVVFTAVSALALSVAAVSITPTKVKFNASDNALYVHYSVSDVFSECGGLRVEIYDTGKSLKYTEWEFLRQELVTSGTHSTGVPLEGTGLNSDDVEDGKPPVVIVLSVIDTCSLTPSGSPVLASGEIKVPDGGGASSGGTAGGGTTVRHYQKTQTLTGVVWTDDGPSALSIKTGKISNKGIVAVSGSVMGVDGKKLAVKSVKLQADSQERLNGTLQVKDGSTIDLTIDEDEMWGYWKGTKFESGEDSVGGTFDAGRSLTFYFPEGVANGTCPDGTLTSLLPEGESVTVANGKWAFAKAASVKWAKPKNMILAPEIYDEASGKGLIVDESKDRTNLSGLKLTYTPKAGSFKGSFKVYAIQNGQLKKFTAKVTGLVVNGTGYGIATVKGGGSFKVEID